MLSVLFYVCMYVHTYVPICTNIYASTVHVRMYVCMYVHVHMYVCTYVHVRMYACTCPYTTCM